MLYPGMAPKSLSVLTSPILGEARPPLFFFQAEDGIRDDLVTGVQTCALPIYAAGSALSKHPVSESGRREIRGRVKRAEPAASWLERGRVVLRFESGRLSGSLQIGRASCRERV